MVAQMARPPQGGIQGRIQSADEATRVRLGAQPGTLPDVLHALASDESVTVRAALALNPATPAEINSALARDADERVRALLARKLGLLAPALSAEAQTGLRRQTLATLTALAEDEAERVRAAIAEAVKDLPDAPRAIILRLAQDAAVSVCEPVIRFSPLLTAGDLVSLVAEAPSAGTLLAVARRPAIDAAVSAALAAGGTGDVVLALLMNGSAQIREATLDGLVDRSVDHPDWHGPLVRRPALSERSRIVADHLLDVLAARSDLDPAITAKLRGMLEERPRLDPAAAEAPGTKPTEDDLLPAARDGDATASPRTACCRRSPRVLPRHDQPRPRTERNQQRQRHHRQSQCAGEDRRKSQTETAEAGHDARDGGQCQVERRGDRDRRRGNEQRRLQQRRREGQCEVHPSAAGWPRRRRNALERIGECQHHRHPAVEQDEGRQKRRRPEPAETLRAGHVRARHAAAHAEVIVDRPPGEIRAVVQQRRTESDRGSERRLSGRGQREVCPVQSHGRSMRRDGARQRKRQPGAHDRRNRRMREPRRT